MNRLGWALGLAALLLPAAASAEPVSVTVAPGSEVTQVSPPSTGWFSVDLGTYDVSAGGDAYLLVDGLRHGSDYTATMTLTGIGGYSSISAEILDPKDNDDAKDPSPQPSYVPPGYSTSNKYDGFSFAQDSALERSVVWSSGSGTVTADEDTNARDMLTFTGLGPNTAMLTFGLRDRLGDRGFLVRFSPNANVPAPVPEPASMLLVGTALAGLGSAFRRRSGRAAR